jgi:hypothetical protein
VHGTAQFDLTSSVQTRLTNHDTPRTHQVVSVAHALSFWQHLPSGCAIARRV